MASSKTKDKYAQGIEFFQDSNAHLKLAKVIEPVLDEGRGVKIIFEDTDGAIGWFRIPKAKFEKVFGLTFDELNDDEKSK